MLSLRPLAIVSALLACACGAESETAGSPTTPPVSPSPGTDAGPTPDGGAIAPDAAAAATCAVRPACDAPPPLLGGARGFRHTSSSLAVATGAARHRGRDLFLLPGQEAWALGKFAYGPLDDDITDEDVDVYLLRDCGVAWTKVGTFRTSHDGEHTAVEGVADTGGRVFVNLAQAGVPPLGVGRHRLLMVVGGDLTTTDQYVEVLPPDAKVVVSDVDGTLTSSEYAAATDVIGLPPPDAHPGAADMMKAFAERGYYLFYLTARPEWMANYSRAWFPLRGFPPGILHTTLSKAGANGAAAAEYKTAELAALKARLGITPSYGFGNKDSDVTAYTAAALSPSRCFYFGLATDLKGGARNDDYRALVPMARAADGACAP